MLCALLLVGCLVAVSLTSATAEGTADATLQPSHIPMQGCYEDFRNLCAGTSELWNCMKRQRDEIHEPSCRAWVDGVIACEVDARKAPGCEDVTRVNVVRRCLRTLSADLVSSSCKDTLFYKRALKLNPARRAQA